MDQECTGTDVQEQVHCAFVILEKAYNRTPRD